jgi:predicted AlkP superfamily phosphohydrolase/phosphomutase
MMTLPDGQQVPFDDYFYRIHSIRSGRHHPDGCFWVQSDTPRRVEERIPLTAVAPTLLRLFGVNVPSYMKEAQVALSCYPN